MNILIANAFSLSMLDRGAQKGTPNGYCPAPGDAPMPARVPRPIGDPVAFLRDATNMGCEIRSVVGHADTATLFASILGRAVPFNRETVKLTSSDILLVGQYVGPRLPEGATCLPEGSSLQWWTV